MINRQLINTFALLSLLITLLASTFAFAESPIVDKEEFLQQRWELVKREIGRQASLDVAYYATMCFFQEKCGITQREFIKINTDLNEEMSTFDVVHILGDVYEDIYLEGHADLVIAGDVHEDVTIFADGIVRIHVHGDFKGGVDSIGSLDMTVGENFSGSVKTGRPSTRLRISGDYTGDISFNGEEGHLLFLHVEGFAAEEDIRKIYQQEYTKVNSSFGSSDMAPGIYDLKKGSSDKATIVGHQ